MTRPSPLQVLDADMPKWAAGGWKPGDAAGVLAALEEAGYVVVNVEALAEAMLSNIDWRHGETVVIGMGNAIPTAAAWLSKIAERSEAAEEVER